MNCLKIKRQFPSWIIYLLWAFIFLSFFLSLILSFILHKCFLKCKKTFQSLIHFIELVHLFGIFKQTFQNELS